MRGKQSLAALALAVTGLASAADPNLLPNGDFSGSNQLAYWTHIGVPDGGMIWSAEDAAGAGGSGSLELYTGASGGGTYALATCFDAQPNAPYSMGGQARRPNGGDPVYFQCFGHSLRACQGFSIFRTPDRFDIGGNNGTAWGESVVTNGTLASDVLSLACQVSWGDFTGNPPGPATLLLDNLFFNSTPPPTSVQLQEFFVK